MRNIEVWRTDFSPFFFWLWAVFNFWVKMTINPVNKGKTRKQTKKRLENYWLIYLYFFGKNRLKSAIGADYRRLKNQKNFCTLLWIRRKMGLTLLLFYSPNASRQRCRQKQRRGTYIAVPLIKCWLKLISGFMCLIQHLCV